MYDLHDWKYALRRLVKTPGFTLATLVTLALGIGANTAIFSIVNGVLLKPLPFPEPERLIGVWQTAPYLHDGSAATLLDAIASPDDRHGMTRGLSAEQQDQLVSYLLQIDNTSYEDESELPSAQPDIDGGTAPEAGAPTASSSSTSDGGGCNVSAGSKTNAGPISALALGLLLGTSTPDAASAASAATTPAATNAAPLFTFSAFSVAFMTRYWFHFELATILLVIAIVAAWAVISERR